VRKINDSLNPLISFLVFLFQSLTLDKLEVRLHNFFYLLSMNLSRSQDVNRKFNRLTRVDLVLFFVFSN
jgi:hypothetical protein